MESTYQQLNILVPKETRAAETRVALVPADAKTLLDHGFGVCIESNAGNAAGFSDADYQQAGAIVRQLGAKHTARYDHLFQDINIILRAKRPSHEREQAELKAIAPHTLLIGALDPFESGSNHFEAYKARELIPYSIDQLTLASDDPKNLLTPMSKLAGRLGFESALRRCKTNGREPKQALIIGFGTAGKAAFETALRITPPLKVTVGITNRHHESFIAAHEQATPLWLDKKASLTEQRHALEPAVLASDIIITSARKPNQQAPILITQAILSRMQANSVIVDLALSEGGNVEGSRHDSEVVLGNQVWVCNSSGYPKALPHEASLSWSKVSLHLLLDLVERKALPALRKVQCLAP